MTRTVKLDTRNAKVVHARIGVKQFETLQVLAPRGAMMILGKAQQREMDRLVDLGLAAYPPPSKASGKTTAADGDFAVITSKGLAALEAAGFWPHPVGERPDPRLGCLRKLGGGVGA
jgi:hypothetical protein